MRIAVRATGEPGMRAARILLGEPLLQRLGYLDRAPQFLDDERVAAVRRPSGYDVVVSDETETPLAVVESALEVGASCVVWSDLWEYTDELDDLDAAFASAGTTLLAGASLGSGIAPALAQHELARTDETLELSLAWTVPGRKLRRGEPLPFPQPVGALWGREIDDDHPPAPERTTRFVAPLEGEWGGAMVRATGILGDGVARRVVGIADHAGHLEGLSLAAGAAVVGTNRAPSGLCWASDVGDDYLRSALEAGLEVATFTAATSRDRG